MQGRVLTIDRSKWRVGGSGRELCSLKGYTKLLNEKGMMCCLGFDSLACGFTANEIGGRFYPSGLARDKSGAAKAKARIPHLITFEDDFCRESEFAQRAIEINDGRLSASSREKKLKEHYATIGVTVEFTGEYQ